MIKTIMIIVAVYWAALHVIAAVCLVKDLSRGKNPVAVRIDDGGGKAALYEESEMNHDRLKTVTNNE